MRDRFESIGRDLGRILEALSGLVLLSVIVPALWGEWWAVPGLIVSGLVPLVLGRVLVERFREAPEPGKLHGMMTAASGWFLVAVFGSLPFLLLAWTVELDPAWLDVPAMTPTLAAFLHPLNAFFESMSGFTGTGLTMTMNEEVLPRTLQWWRSFSEWVGGVGVIVLTTAILARPGSGSMTLYESEARSERIHPSIVSTVRTIWWIFVLFTLVSVLLLWAAGMPAWEALNHAMTGLSTGGFSVTDQSIASYDSLAIHVALIPIMVAGAIAFPVHYLVLRGDVGALTRDLQSRWVLGMFLLGSVIVVGLLLWFGTEEVGAAGIVMGTFQFVSAASCTGFQTAPGLAGWPVLAQLVLGAAMVVGAAAGSTAGGIKAIRSITFIKGSAYRIQSLFRPASAVHHLRLGDRVLSREEAAYEFEEAAIISFLWFVFLAVGIAVLLLTLPVDQPGGFTLTNVIFEVASAQGNVGLSTGITGPAMPTFAKSIFLFNMWIGRLEIIPVLVLLRSFVSGGGR